MLHYDSSDCVYMIRWFNSCSINILWVNLNLSELWEVDWFAVWSEDFSLLILDHISLSLQLLYLIHSQLWHQSGGICKYNKNSCHEILWETLMCICFGCFILLQVYGLVQYTAMTKTSLRSDALPVPDTIAICWDLTQGLSFGIPHHLFTISAVSWCKILLKL